MFCSRCGASNADGAKYCVSCGALLEPNRPADADWQQENRGWTMLIAGLAVVGALAIVAVLLFS
ncbi:MAG: zinc-ribbon domain-containing protein [Candidatus Methanomethylophilus sp.]|nr:zinc-ribbon domain-containing protein [Methanomethylophilus sp.]MDD3232913.1 zinc-ribbon domain-containing protein [Methanomethylophilus sp.]MDD4222889.1 zinc-ribbon domain-containing protein [Methanomethylophilus sp.]MDD4668488.1 zinc-ribbon domain-containing protein [Methanomethylophilus sp.]